MCGVDSQNTWKHLCMLEAGTLLFANKQNIIDTIRDILLSASTYTWNTERLVEEHYKHLKQVLAAADPYALASDRSCVTGTAELIVFVWFLDNVREQFMKEL